MTPKEALEILIKSVQNNSNCGRLSSIEREAIKILKDYFKEGENK